MEKKFDLEDRLVAFAVNASLFSTDLPNDITGVYYANKAGICLKELKESRVNLKILSRLNYGDKSKNHDLLDEVEQLIKIIATIIKIKK